MKPTFQIALNADQFNALAAKLKTMGFGADALEKGTLPETRGVVLSYVVDVQLGATPTATVTFTVEKKPLIAPVSMIESGVKEMMGIG
jgi:hypothetical protein